MLHQRGMGNCESWTTPRGAQSCPFRRLAIATLTVDSRSLVRGAWVSRCSLHISRCRPPRRHHMSFWFTSQWTWRVTGKCAHRHATALLSPRALVDPSLRCSSTAGNTWCDCLQLVLASISVSRGRPVALSPSAGHESGSSCLIGLRPPLQLGCEVLGELHIAVSTQTSVVRGLTLFISIP